ncbi:DUF6924 domain-containing protein [Streptomyces sp. NPDC015144]|uniref:DUF6924 domain-containing protein n=1 Tax=Streptomyces sp. NPDC015144 TaxID=3364944 RepID=UPI003701E2F2
MRVLPAAADRDEDALVVRTDYLDEQVWQDVVAVLLKPWGDEQYEAHVCFVDDAAWVGASVDDVLAAVRGDDDPAVVFLADRTTMQAESHPLLAVTTLTREDCVDEEDYEQLIESAPPPQRSTRSTRT